MKYIKCQFCAWKTPMQYRNKKGKFVGQDKADSRLLRHIEYAHPEEGKRIIEDRKKFAEEMGSSEPVEFGGEV